MDGQVARLLARLARGLVLWTLVLAGARAGAADTGAPGAAGPSTGGRPHAVTASQSDLPAAPQDLGVLLIGTVVVSPGDKSVAVLEDRRTGAQGVYRRGERCGDVEIRRILPRAVVIDAGRGEELLALDSATGGAGGQSPAPPATVVDRTDVAAELPTAPQSDRQIRTRLDHRDGRLRGLIVYNIHPGSAFARMSLLDGDVILAINGVPVTTTAEILELYDTMERGGTFSLEVDRGESPQELQLEIR